jgi:hypothetical protein
MTQRRINWDLVVCGIACLLAIFLIVWNAPRAYGDTKVLTIAPFAIDGVEPAVTHFAEQTGPGAFQAVYYDGTRNVYLSAVEGFPCLCRPAGQLQVYGAGDFAAVDFGMDLRSTTVAFDANSITLTDAAPIRTHPGDFNGDGVTSVQDIFDFLVTQPTPGEVFAFLEGWYSL